MRRVLDWFTRERAIAGVQLATALTAVFYILGQVVTSTYYRRFGISPNDVGLQYTDIAAQAILSVGALAVFGAAIALGLLTLASLLPERWQTAWLNDRVLTSLTAGASAATPVVFLAQNLRDTSSVDIGSEFGPPESALEQIFDTPLLAQWVVIFFPLAIMAFLTTNLPTLPAIRTSIAQVEAQLDVMRPGRRRQRRTRRLEELRKEEAQLLDRSTESPTPAIQPTPGIRVRSIAKVGSVVFSLAAVAAGFVLILRSADDAADSVMRGQPRSPFALVPFGPQPSSVRVQLTDDSQMLSGKCVVRLGSANGQLIVVEPKENKTWYIGADDLSAMSGPC